MNLGWMEYETIFVRLEHHLGIRAGHSREKWEYI